MTAPRSEARNWAIVGGGLLGLVLAHRLSLAGHRVTVFEAEGQTGGLAGTWSLDGIVWDKHYHVTLLSDAFTRQILHELELASETVWVETRTGYYADERVSSLSNAIDYLHLPGLNWIDKIRLGCTIVGGSQVRDWKRLKTIPVADYLTRWSGRRTFERLWRPLLQAKLGESYRECSAAFIWATIQRLYAARRTGLKKEMFGYVKGGYARILERFEERLRKQEVRFELGAPVTSVVRVGEQFEVCANGRSDTFDRVAVTLAPAQAARICTGLPAAELDGLRGFPYQGIICASLLCERPLDGYYLTYLTEEDLPFTTIIEMSALVGCEPFAGKMLVYLPRYLAPDDPMFEMSDEQIRELFLPKLERIYPGFKRGDVSCFQVSRESHVFPIPRLNYSEKLPPMKTGQSGLHIVNSAHIVNGTLNVNETVHLAERTAAALISSDGLESASTETEQ
ncbi:MAG: FAD-dependent oxidoreductase [bacterium]|nr:FAD-dependent oxidoreductase [bacterium]